ncbi:MAG: hypothetical protein JXR97_01135, partial [Planctomycetes bacterium]|nr:hypothetical protein [Planctomycetota bacterium]
QTTGNAFASTGETVRDAGQNLAVAVNGQRVEADGLTLKLSQDNVTGTITFDSTAGGVAQGDYNQDTATDATTARNASLTNIQGGMQFQLGEGGGVQNRNVFSLQSFSTSNLGRVEVNGETLSLADLRAGGKASLANDPVAALKIIDQAIADVSAGRAQIGAYQANTLQTNVNSLSVAIENVTATESSIRDTDVASEVTNLVKQQLLEKLGVFGVQSSNMNRDNIMKLLGG